MAASSEGRRAPGSRRPHRLGRGPALAAVLLGLAALVGCQQMVQPAADAMYNHVRSVAGGDVRNWGDLRAGINAMAPQLVQQLKQGTPPAPDEAEMQRIQSVYDASKGTRWPFPEGDDPMVVSPDPAGIPADLPPAPGR